LQEAGTVLHLARSGRLIIKADSQVPDGKLLVDEGGRRAGKVMETIGPVTSPYLSVQPMTDRIESVVGTKLYVSDTPLRENVERRFSSQRERRQNKFQKRSSRQHEPRRPRNR
jgi:rRNA processing protein Gar1